MDFITNSDLEFPSADMRKAILDAASTKRADFIDATRLAMRLFGDSIVGTHFLLGYAFQREFIPFSFEVLDRAIELNNVSVAANRKAFAWGRLAADDPAALPLHRSFPASRFNELLEMDECDGSGNCRADRDRLCQQRRLGVCVSRRPCRPELSLV